MDKRRTRNVRLPNIIPVSFIHLDMQAGNRDPLIISSRDQPAALVLGDNIFFGAGFGALLAMARARKHGATVVGYKISDATAYTVAKLKPGGRALSSEEKPKQPPSDVAETVRYFFMTTRLWGSPEMCVHPLVLNLR